jgi:hypothetical protein
MMHSSRPQPSGSSRNAPALRNVFVRRVHQLLQLGYQRLSPAAQANEQEPSITGFLAKAIDEVLSDRAETWMAYFSVHDDPAVNDGRRKGKRRKRVDLRIDSGRYRPRARYQFEAKRFSKRHSVKTYLGANGLGCFLCGAYAREEDEAGMLGYVQSGELETWGEKIRTELNETPGSYAVDRASPFSSHPMLSSGSLKTYRSQHSRQTVGRTIVIMHTLLKFH